MFYYHDTIPKVYQPVNGFKKLSDIMKMKAGCGLIEYKQNMVFGDTPFLANERRKLDALCFPAAQAAASDENVISS